MKNYKRIKACLVFVIFLTIFSGCKKNETSFLSPKVSGITSIKDLETIVTKGSMGDWIAIHGSALESFQSVQFNDVKVDSSQVYYENNILYLQIPVKMPLEITNKVYVSTQGGNAEFDFVVDIPELQMTHIFNEYTLPGDTVKIYGRFLNLYEVDSSTTVVSFNGIESPVISSTDAYLTAKVPLNVETNVKVEVVNNKYNTRAVCPGFYQDKNNIITTFDPDYPYTGATGQQFVTNGPNPKPTSGQYIRFEVDQSSYPNGLGWFYLFESSYNYTLDMVHNPEDYVLKFELNMAVPIKTTAFFLYYYWAVAPQPLGGETFNVQTLGEWQTISIPLEKIIPLGNTGTSTNFSLNMRIENPAPVERVAMYFDNFRIYKEGE